jgi:5-methylcytosine-specific restriction endonuclease McrA
MSLTLRPYQERCLADLWHWFERDFALPKRQILLRNSGREGATNTRPALNIQPVMEAAMSDRPDTGNPSATQENIGKADARALGLTHYFTGKACPHGHVANRYVNSGQCVDCIAAKGKARKTYFEEWRKANLDRCAGYTRAYRERNPEAKERAKAVRANRKPRERELERKRYQRDHEKMLAKNEAYRKARPDIYAAHARNRRALAKQAEGCHTATEIAALYQRQRGRCANCKASLKPGYHADHIVPLVRGGSNWIANIQLLCPPCNMRKGALHPIEWAQREGRLV